MPSSVCFNRAPPLSQTKGAGCRVVKVIKAALAAIFNFGRWILESISRCFDFKHAVRDLSSSRVPVGTGEINSPPRPTGYSTARYGDLREPPLRVPSHLVEIPHRDPAPVVVFPVETTVRTSVVRQERVEVGPERVPQPPSVRNTVVVRAVPVPTFQQPLENRGAPIHRDAPRFETAAPSRVPVAHRVESSNIPRLIVSESSLGQGTSARRDLSRDRFTPSRHPVSRQVESSDVPVAPAALQPQAQKEREEMGCRRKT